MTIFQKDVNQTTWEYKVTTVSVSIITYLVALAFVLFVQRKDIKRMFLTWRYSIRDRSPVEGKHSPARGAPAGPASSPRESKSPADGANNNSGPHQGAKEGENTADEGIGDAAKTQPFWHNWARVSPSRRANSQVPDKDSLA